MTQSRLMRRLDLFNQVLESRLPSGISLETRPALVLREATEYIWRRPTPEGDIATVVVFSDRTLARAADVPRLAEGLADNVDNAFDIYDREHPRP